MQERSEWSEPRWAWLLWWAPSLLYWGNSAIDGVSSAALWAAQSLLYAAFLVVLWMSFGAWRTRPTLTIGAMVLLCLIGQVFPSGSGIFMYYAIARLGELHGARLRWLVGTAIFGITAVEAWALGRGLTAWLLASLLLAIVGAYSVFLAGKRRSDARLRLQQQEIERLATAAERERIARDLHDSVGHALSLTLVKLKLIDRLADHDLVRARQEITDLEDVIRDTLRDVRALVHGYIDGDFDSALEHARIALEAAGVVTTLCVQTTADDQHGQAMGLVLKEAVTNIIRHANASQCHIHLNTAGGRIRLEINDDGSGQIDATGFGLRSIRTRIHDLGGTVLLEERSHRLIVTLPLSAPRPAAA